MMRLNIRLSKTVNIIIIISFIIALMYFADAVLIPLTFGVIFAFLLTPVSQFFERKGVHRVLAIILTFFAVLIMISGIIALLSAQIINLFDNILVFREKLVELGNRIVNIVDERVLGDEFDLWEFYKGERNNLIRFSTGLISKTITSSTTVLVFTVFVVIYTFLFLLYRTSFKQFILMITPGDMEEDISRVLRKLRYVVQRYFLGMFLVIVIIGTLNGIGLFIIGLDYPFLFGYFAALLTIVPYIGTTIGGLLPFLYALINHDSLWMPLGVAILYASVQALEGNLITPKLVGNQVSINPLVALIALVSGGLIWGIAGIILFIPLTGLLKVVFDNIESLKPYGMLLSSEFPSRTFNAKK